MFSANENDTIGKALCGLIDAAIPINQSLKEEDFDWYVEDLQDNIIKYFNNHMLKEVPTFIDRMTAFANYGSMTDDKKRRYAAAVCLETLIQLFPFDDYIPQFESIIEQLLRPGFKRLVIVGAKVVGSIGYISGPNRNHLIHVLVEKNVSILRSSTKPEFLYAAAVILRELAKSAPEHIFSIGDTFSETIISSMQCKDQNVRQICVEIVETLFNSKAASVGQVFLTKFLNDMRVSSVRKLSPTTPSGEVAAYLRLLLILLKQRPYMSKEDVVDDLLPFCCSQIQSIHPDTMMSSIQILLFLNKSNTTEIQPNIIKQIFDQLFAMTPKNNKSCESIFPTVIESFPGYVCSKLSDIMNGCRTLVAVLPKNIGPPFVFKLIVAMVRVVRDQSQLTSLLNWINEILLESTVATPIHMLLQALNETHSGWDLNLTRYKQYLVRLIHEELTEPCQRWESAIISLNAIDQLHNLSYPDAIMLHSLVLQFIDSPDWQVRERVAYSVIHCFEGAIEKVPLDSMIKLVDMAVDDPIRSVRKKSLMAFTPEVYNYIAQPEIIDKFARLIHDESFMVRKLSIDILGELMPSATASILRDMLLTTLRQLPDKYNPIIPPRISDTFPHLIWASQSFIHLYADAIYQRFIKMLSERFNKGLVRDQSLVYMNSAQLRDIDGSLIKSLSRLNELRPDIVLAGPLIEVLSTVLEQAVHPWTKTHALKALKNIVQGSEDVSYLIKDHPRLVQALMKIVRKNTSIKLVTKSLKVLGALGCCNSILPIKSKRKDIFIFHSFFNSIHQFRRYFVRLLFQNLFEVFQEPMIDAKKETIARVITDIFVADPECIAQYLSSFFNIFLPELQAASIKTMKYFFTCLTTIITLAGRQIVPYATAIYKAIETPWRQQLTVEGSRVLRALIKAAYGQCDSILHLVVPICFELIKFKTPNAAKEIFKLIQDAADYTPSYLTIIVQGISDLAVDPETSDTILGYCVKTIKFIITIRESIEHLSTIKRCVTKLKNNAGAKHREAAINLLEIIDQRRAQDEKDIDDDDDPIFRPIAPEIAMPDIQEFSNYLHLPKGFDDVTIAKWYHNLEERLLVVAPSPVVHAIRPLSKFTGLLPKFSFHFAFLSIWLQSNNKDKATIAELLNKIFECDTLPDWIMKQFVDLVEFSVLSEIDLRLDETILVKCCEKREFWAMALLFHNTSPSVFPPQKEVFLWAKVQQKETAQALAEGQGIYMDHELWMQLGDWDMALKQIAKTVDPSRFIYSQVVCMAEVEDWEGILAKKDCFFDLKQQEKVKIARYFMTAETYAGNEKKALEFMDSTNGFSVEDQIMRATMLIRLGMTQQAASAVHLGWRYLSASVSAIKTCNKGMISRQLLQAEQLIELSEVLNCIRRPEAIEKTYKVWKGRLKLIENLPEIQKELIKIRSLVNNLPHFDAMILDNISYFIWLNKHHVAKRLGDVFFPDEDSHYGKYVALELSGREEKIDEMLELARTCDSPELRSRLHELVGNIKLKRPISVDALKEILGHFTQANKSQEKVANVNILLAHSTGDKRYATAAAGAIGLSAKSKIIKRSLFANQLLGLLANFGSDEDVSQAINAAFEQIPTTNLTNVYGQAFGLLLHPNESVTQVAMNLCLRLVSEFPQYVGFQLLQMEKIHSDIQDFEDLYDKLQMESAVTFSQVSLVFQQLLKLASPIHIRAQEILDEALSDDKRSFKLMQKIVKVLTDSTMCVFDKQLIAGQEHQISQLRQNLQSKTKVTREEIDLVKSIIASAAKNYSSIRVIRLTSVSEHLERKSKWTIHLLGRQSLDPHGVKISKFFHSVGNLGNLLQITLIGTDGKRYGYELRLGKGALAISQFADLINDVGIGICRHGRITKLSEQVHLLEMPKNQITMHEMVTIYTQSKQRMVDGENFAIRMWKYSNYANLDHEQRVQVLEKLRTQFDSTELSHALLVTSKDADSWIHRVTNFAWTLGSVSAIAFILGTVDHSPSEILIDKTHGSVTFNTLFGNTFKSQPVPFRFTPMIKNALGKVKGQFSKSFTQTMREIRKRGRAMAPFLQLIVNQEPYQPAALPSHFMKELSIETPEHEENDLDLMYNRIAGTGIGYMEELEKLVEKAQDVNCLAQMPASWYPWW